MKKLLIFVDWFAPGFKGGGQIQSCVNLAKAFQHRMQVMVVTTDRDLGSEEPYDSIRVDEWNTFDEKVEVMYLSPEKRGYKAIGSIIRSVKPDTIYLNSMFSYNFTLLPMEVCRFDKWRTRVILAPRGMLHSGALQYKKLKKKLFFQAFKARNFHKRILFHATDGAEEKDIRQVFGKDARFKYVADFPASRQDVFTSLEKQPGTLKCLFISRISPKKNLSYLLELISKSKDNVQLSIIGPVEDADYWEECKRIMATLPANIQVDFLGPVPNHQLPEIYLSHHLFVLPTHGENFGHVIFESLVNGRPVLISNLTPWRQLAEKQAGWDLPLKDEAGFIAALSAAVNWNQQQFDEYASSSWKLASTYTDTAALEEQYLQLFE